MSANPKPDDPLTPEESEFLLKALNDRSSEFITENVQYQELQREIDDHRFQVDGLILKQRKLERRMLEKAKRLSRG